MSLDYKSKIDKKLENYINDVKGFKEILYSHNAYIAGGFLLSAITNDSFETSDIDIYVSAVNFDSLIESFNIWKDSRISINFDYNTKMIKMLSDKETKCSTKKNIVNNLGKCNLIMASEYDHSFFKKNNIKFKTEIQLKGHSKKSLKCDIMVINNDTKVLDVINNFDLTCCQVWYNGSEFNGSHLKDIKLKKAYLNKDYVASLINNNYFIKNRIEKYTKRGFQIEIPNSIYKINENIKSISNTDKFIVKLVITYYIIKLHSIFKHYILTPVILNGSINTLFSYLNIFEEFNTFNSTNFKLKCKNLCLLEFKLKTKNYNKKDTVDILYIMILKYINSFTIYSITELKLNTVLYFGTNYKFVLKKIKALFTSVLQKVKDKNKKLRIQKIVSKMNNILGKQDDDKTDDTLEVFRKYVYNDFNLPFVKKIESIELEVDRTLEGRDIIEMEDRTIEEHLAIDPNNICIIGLNENNNITTVSLTSIDCLSIYLRDMNSGWFYKCIETENDSDSDSDSENNIEKSIAYVKIPLTFTIYVPYYELYDIIKNKSNIVFYKSSKVTIKKTANHVNTFQDHPSNIGIDDIMVSANHCQDGSNINVFNLYRLGKTFNVSNSSTSSSSSSSSSSSLFKNLKKISNVKATSDPYKKTRTKVLEKINKSKS